ncbi:MAG: GGDEF domain-containing response regulator [Chitinispirillales bacterium]|jgi:diguanylate cyclase (GGDEF)-like protein|nr:GGDEF domain-containing response regulator [Chitinispirillales bacterium]
MDTINILSKTSALIVDDDGVMAGVLKSALATRLNVTVCGSAGEAIPLIGANNFDIVVTDLTLPDASGIDVLTFAKSRDDFVEVLVITGNATLDSATAAINLGAASYLIKPFPISDFISSIDKMLASRLFHLKSLKLMKQSDLISPSVKGHESDITSLYYFASKLMLSLEISEVMRITLEEINQKTGTGFCSVGVNLLGYTEIYSMPVSGELNKEELSGKFADNWNSAFSYFEKEKFLNGGIPLYIYKGRQGEAGNLSNLKYHSFPLVVTGKTIGGMNVWIESDKEIEQSVNQYLYILTSIISPVIEHVYLDLQTQFQAKTDSLTGIANHRQFFEALDREIARANRKKSNFTLVLLDIDNFKLINDTYGHQVGDAVIINLTKRLVANIRTGDVVARYGGEEFGMILPDTGSGGALVLTDRICEAIAGSPFVSSKLQFTYTASFGLAVYEGGKPSRKDSLIKRADSALYKSKRDGKNRVTVSGGEADET